MRTNWLNTVGQPACATTRCFRPRWRSLCNWTVQLDSYGDPPPNLAALAAAYGHGLARLHPFVDGNKRTALVVAESFIDLHQHMLEASDAECVQVFLALAAGELPEIELAGWLRARIAQAAR